MSGPLLIVSFIGPGTCRPAYSSVNFTTKAIVRESVILSRDFKDRYIPMQKAQ